MFTQDKDLTNVIAFTTYFRTTMMRLYDTVKIAQKAKGPEQKAIAYFNMGRYFLNHAITGAMAMGLRNMIFFGPIALAFYDWDKDEDKKIDEGYFLDMLKKGALYSLLSGPADVLFRKASDGVISPSDIVNITVPSNIIGEWLEYATGKGRYEHYRGWDRTKKFMKNSMTINPAIATWAGLMHLGEKDVTLEAARKKFYEYRRDNLPFSQGDILVNEREKDDEFLSHMRKAVEILNKKPSLFMKREEILKKGVQELAAAVKSDMANPQRVAQSLQGRMMLSRLSDKEKIELRKSLGDTLFIRLAQHDEELKIISQIIRGVIKEVM